MEAFICFHRKLTMLMRIRFQKLGGHYHCRVFTRKLPHTTWEKCGDLTFRENEWRDVLSLMSHLDIEFLEEDTENS